LRLAEQGGNTRFPRKFGDIWHQPLPKGRLAGPRLGTGISVRQREEHRVIGIVIVAHGGLARILPPDPGACRRVRNVCAAIAISRDTDRTGEQRSVQAAVRGTGKGWCRD